MNNDIPVKIPSYSYVLVSRSILCNCGIEAHNHYLLESLAICANKRHNLVMYFTINMAFTNYLNILPNLTIPSLIRDRTTCEQPLPVNLTFPVFENSLKDAPTNLKSFMCSYIIKKFLISNKGMYLQLNCRYLHLHSLNNLTNINYLSHLSIL